MTLLDVDIKTRLELTNETMHTTGYDGQAGRVALIGAFPSTDDSVQSFENLQHLREFYNIVPDTPSETQFDAARSAKRLFMDGLSGYKGASEVLCVNILDTDVTISNTLTVEVANGTETTSTTTVSEDLKNAMKMSWDDLNLALHKLAEDDIDILYISSDLRDAIPEGKTIGDVWNHVIEFVDSEFKAQRPANIIGCVRCTENISQGQVTGGIGSTKINVTGKETTTNGKKTITTWGAKQISELFQKTNNELTTCGLYFQGGKINDESVDEVEMTAHMAGWTATLPVSQDLTHQVIPGVTGVDEEVYFGENDAGTYLNKCGIQVIKPINRLNNQYVVQNSINPSGWHVNHVRAVSYLLKQYGFEAGLGINNFTTNLEAFKASLNNVTLNVLKQVDVIRSVEIGELEVLADYAIFVPLKIELAGVVTLIKVGVEMVLPENGVID